MEKNNIKEQKSNSIKKNEKEKIGKESNNNNDNNIEIQGEIKNEKIIYIQSINMMIKLIFFLVTKNLVK